MSDVPINQASLKGSMAGSVRNAKASFEQIQPAQLTRFIEAQADVTGSVAVSDLSHPVDGAGSSNGIALFTATLDRGRGVELLDLVLRYSPGPRLLKQKRYREEVETLRLVTAAGLPAPKALWLDEDGSLLGREGFVMERVRGETPSAAMYSGGPLALATPEARKEMMLKAADFHGRLNAAAIGPDQATHLAVRGDGATAIDRELNWWFGELELVLDKADPKRALIEPLRRWMLDHQPRDVYAPRLVHGDAQIANIIYRDGDIAAVVDWELSYLGHNEADLALLVFLTETQKVTDTPVEGVPTEQDYIDRYQQASGSKIQHWNFFKLMNMYRIMSVTALSADFLPSFDDVWKFFAGYMRSAWDEARDVYS